MNKILDVLSNISQPLGIAGIFAGATFLIFREILRRNFFPRLTRDISGDIIKMIIKSLSMLALVSMILGFAGFVIALIYRHSPAPEVRPPGPEMPLGKLQETAFRGRVIDARTAKIIRGARIRVTAQDKTLIDESDSKGIFVVRLQVPIQTADFRVDLRVEADNYITYFEHDVSVMTSQQVSLERTKNSGVERDPTNTRSDRSSISSERNLAGIELSYKPSKEQWTRIIEALGRATTIVPEIFRNSARLTAEKIRDDWVITFSPLQRREGVVTLPQISTANHKVFEDVLREAMIGLSVRWGVDPDTNLELGQQYPASIRISQAEIAFTLRPPELMLSVASLKANPTITLRGASYPNDLRILSLDPGVELDQTLHLSWKNEDSTSGEHQRISVSGPHHLNIEATSFITAITNDSPEPVTNSCECASCDGMICCPNPGSCLPCGDCGLVCCGNESLGFNMDPWKRVLGLCLGRNSNISVLAILRTNKTDRLNGKQ